MSEKEESKINLKEKFDIKQTKLDFENCSKLEKKYGKMS